MAINLHCIPTVLSRCSQDLSNGRRNKCKATLTRVGGHSAARSTREQVIHDQREVGVFGQVTDGGDGAEPQRLSGRGHPRFPFGFPRGRRTAPTAGGPQVRAVSAGRSVQMVGGRLLMLEGHQKYLLGRASEQCFCAGYRRPLVVSVQAKAGVQDTVQEGAQERWRPKGSQIVYVSRKSHSLPKTHRSVESLPFSIPSSKSVYGPSCPCSVYVDSTRARAWPAMPRSRCTS